MVLEYRDRRSFLKATVGGAAAMTVAGCMGSLGDDDVTVGFPLPLSGEAGQIGENMRDVHQFLIDVVVNEDHPDLDPFIFGDGEGLPNFGETVNYQFVDHRGDPGEARAETRRLIQSHEVDLVVGATLSGATRTARSVCEQEGVPMVTGTASGPELTEAGLEWFWRPTPHDGIFVQNTLEFLEDLNDHESLGPDISTAVITHEDTEFGTGIARIQEERAEEFGIDVLETITYTAETLSSFSAQTDVIRDHDPDVLLHTGYFDDGILVMETFKERGYYPPMMLASGGLVIDSFYEDFEDLANYQVQRSAFNRELAEELPAIQTYADMFTEETGQTLGSINMRAMNGSVVGLAAIDRAESTDPAEIQSTLNELDLTRDEVGAPWDVEFDETGQNPHATGVIQQIHDAAPTMVWPFNLLEDFGADVTDRLDYPTPAWDER